jgi:GNAT superfamily N-acetyltransferase
MRVDTAISVKKLDVEGLEAFADKAENLFLEERDEEFDRGTFRAFWREMISEKKGTIFVAKKMSETIGGLSAGLYKRQDTGDVAAEVLTWYVTQDERGGDVGTTLFEAFEGWARTMGADIVVSSMSEHGSTLNEFHKERGYDPFEIKYEKKI